MKRREILEMAQKYFFAAMKMGWAAGVKAEDVPGMPGYKQVDCGIGDFRILDRYCVSDAGSAGTTTVWFLWPTPSPKPVWFMSYGGFYRKEDIPFLKRALMAAYKKNDFNGGRGPVHYREGEEEGLRYFNGVDYPEGKSSFESFSGKEHIGFRGDIVGHHWYWGMALI